MSHAEPVRSYTAATARAAWWLLTLLAVLVGGVSLRYALPRVHNPAPLPNFRLHHGALVAHAVSAACALPLGPWQFLAGLRRRRPALHRGVGRAYAAALLVAALTALWIAPGSAAGAVSSTGFMALALGWLVTTGAGVTLRIYLAIILWKHMNFQTGHATIAWLCWLPNLLAAELWLRWSSPDVTGSLRELGGSEAGGIAPALH